MRGAIHFNPAVASSVVDSFTSSLLRSAIEAEILDRRPYAAVRIFTIMNLAQLIPVLASAVAVTAAISDVRERRIPNRLTYPAMAAGLALQAAVHGWRGLLLGLGGALLFGGLFLIFHLVRAMGAGDVKLAAALGCIIGPASSWQVMFATAVAGGALAILVMVFTGRVLKTLRSTLAVVGFHAVHGLRTHPEVNLDNPAAVRLPYGLAFAAGTLYWAFLMPMWR
ncbi:MAG TPA: A24 family peptidase [Candidatus Angelobacter sp.]|nr:A24 family peptidase [Candidatus Angelobacter sp.]